MSTGRKVGVGGDIVTIVIALVVMVLGGDPREVLNLMESQLEAGDIEEAMNAAQAVGDDRIQMESQRYVVPDSFTHGTSAQRMKWFKLGLKPGT